MRAKTSGIGAMALAALVSGCAASPASLSAGQVGCPANEIQISEHDKSMQTSNWIATCRGERFFCSAHKTEVGWGQVSCSPERGSAKAAAARSSGSAAPAQDARSVEDDVRRLMRRSDGNERAFIEARLNLEPFKLRVFRRASASGSSRIVTQMQAPPGQHEQCSLRVMIDGELVELEKAGYRRNEGLEEVASKIPQELVRRMATAERVAGRVCSDEFRLGDYDQQVLDEYLARLAEESAWSGESEPATEATAGEAGIDGGDAGVAAETSEEQVGGEDGSAADQPSADDGEDGEDGIEAQDGSG